MSLIALDTVSVRFGTHSVLRDVSLAVPAGQTLAVIGESGCGKTVTLKLVVGLLRPTEGRVTFEGKSVGDLPDRVLTKLRLRIGFLFQNAALFDSLDVFENVAFGLRAKGGLAEQEIRELVTQRINEVGLKPDVVSKMPAELSGGMRKRIGLARALALDPEVVLYDEPTTGLDPIMSDVINQLIVRTRQRRPVTSVVVTHDMNTVWKVADRVVMLYPLSRLAPGESQVIFDGPPEQLRACEDERVRSFVTGEATQRLAEFGLEDLTTEDTENTEKKIQSE